MIGTAGQDPAGDLEVPDHLVRLPGGRWGVWKWAALRGAGFPCEEVMQLAATPSCLAAADHLLASEEVVEQRRLAALETVRAALDQAADRRRLIRAIRKLRKGKLPAATAPAVDPALAAFREACQHREQARLAYAEDFQGATVQLTHTLRTIARGDNFREAILWQNRRALKTGVDALLRRPGGNVRRDRKERGFENLIASYFQRYCTKNDSIGFFGPVGWARLNSAGPTQLSCGPRLVAERWVGFESWGIDAVAESLTAGRPIHDWVAPWKSPFFVLDRDVYHPLNGAPIRLSREQLAVFAACDGERIAKEIAQALIHDPAMALHSVAEVYAILRDFVTWKMVRWHLEVPLVARPELALRRRLERIEDAGLREPMLRELDELDRIRREIAEAAGRVPALDRAFGELESRFTSLTSRSASRLGGRTYAGRTLVYEDCRRDLSLELGGEVLESLGPPLTLILASARWLSHKIASDYRQSLWQAYQEARDAAGAPTISLIQLLQRSRLLLGGERSSQVKNAAREMRRRWAEVLALPEGERRVRRSVAELRSRCREAFAAPGPGWKLARQQCPDVMIAAPSVEAVQRGDYQLVLGEVHLATNTLRSALFVDSHPQKEELLRAMDRDVPEPRVIPWLGKRKERPEALGPLGTVPLSTSVRLDVAMTSPKDVRVALIPEPPADPNARTYYVGDFFVAPVEDRLLVLSRDRELQFEIVDFFDLALSAQIINSFKILPRRPHLPRVSFDRLVVQRETWRTPAGEVPFAGLMPAADRFLSARRWARGLGMPRFVFARVAHEPKPLFVDFDSPHTVEILAKALRRSPDHGLEGADLAISEMLPSPDQVWLPDAEGHRYTSELRVVAVDLA